MKVPEGAGLAKVVVEGGCGRDLARLDHDKGEGIDVGPVLVLEIPEPGKGEVSLLWRRGEMAHDGVFEKVAHNLFALWNRPYKVGVGFGENVIGDGESFPSAKEFLHQEFCASVVRIAFVAEGDPEGGIDKDHSSYEP